MALLPSTGLETHPAGTTNVGGIINANWATLEALFDPALSSGDPFHNAIAKALTRSATLPTAAAALEWSSTKPSFRPILAAATYAATVDIPATGPRYAIVSLTGDIVITVSALAAGLEFGLIMQADGTSRAITWPASIIWLGTAPTALAAGKTIRVQFLSTGTTAAALIATFDVQP